MIAMAIICHGKGPRAGKHQTSPLVAHLQLVEVAAYVIAHGVPIVYNTASTYQPHARGEVCECGGEGEGGGSVGGQPYFNGPRPLVHRSLQLDLKQLIVLQRTIGYHHGIVELTRNAKGGGVGEGGGNNVTMTTQMQDK